MNRFTTKVCLLFLISFYSFLSYAVDDQFQQKKDSLLKIIPTLEGKEKLRAYGFLITLKYPKEEIDTMFHYYDVYISEAKQLGLVNKEIAGKRSQLVNFVIYSRRDEFEKNVYPYLDLFYQNKSRDNYFQCYEAPFVCNLHHLVY